MMKRGRWGQNKAVGTEHTRLNTHGQKDQGQVGEDGGCERRSVLETQGPLGHEEHSVKSVELGGVGMRSDLSW